MVLLVQEWAQDGLPEVFSKLLLKQASGAWLDAVYQGKRENCLHRVRVGLEEFLLVEPWLQVRDFRIALPRGLLLEVFHELVEHRGVLVARRDGRGDEGGGGDEGRLRRGVALAALDGGRLEELAAVDVGHLHEKILFRINIIYDVIGSNAILAPRLVD